MVRCIHFLFIVLLITWRKQGILGLDVDLYVTDTTCVGNNVTLRCTINPFTTAPSATWSRNGSTALTTCTNSAFCTQDDLTINNVKYSFSGSSTGIYVSFQIQLLEEGIEWICNHNATLYRYTFNVLETCRQFYVKSDEAGDPSLGSQGGSSGGTGGCYFMVTRFCNCIQFTFLVAQQLYFSTRYVINGRVFYGIEFVIIAAFTQVLCTVPIWVILGLYEALIYLIILPSLITVWSCVAVMVYLLLKALFCQKEWTHTVFKDELMHRSLSDDYGIKFNTINKDKIWFKVWARDDVLMTLHGYEKRPFLNIIIGYGDRLRKVIINSKSSIPIVDCNDVLNTTEDKYRIFYLTCKEHDVTVVRVLNGEEEIVLEWSNTKSSKPLDISDIVISNYMRDLKDPEVTERQTQTRAEWIFFIRQGDGLNEDEDDSFLAKTVTLVLVVLLPIAWIVLPILFLRKCIKPKGPLEMTYQYCKPNTAESITVSLLWKAPTMCCVKKYLVERFNNDSQGWDKAGSSNEPHWSDVIDATEEKARYRVKACFTCFVSQPLEAEEFIVFDHFEDLGPLEYTENMDGNQDVATIRWQRSILDTAIGYRIETRQNDEVDWDVVINETATLLRFRNRQISHQHFTHSALISARQVSVRTRYKGGLGHRLIRQRSTSTGVFRIDIASKT